MGCDAAQMDTIVVADARHGSRTRNAETAGHSRNVPDSPKNNRAVKKIDSPPPVHPEIPHVVSSPYGDRTDEYYWMRDDDRSSPVIRAALDEENAYADRVLAGTADLKATIYAELVAMIKPDDESVPVKDGVWLYGMRYHEGSEYPLYYRRPVDGGDEHVMLDVDAQAQGFDFYSVGAMEVSPDDRLLVYTEDTVSRRQYTVRVRDLSTGLDLPDRIPGCESAVAWADDGTTVLYIEQDPATLLGVRVKAHVVGTDPATDRLVYENTDDRYYLDVRRSRSKRHLFIDLDATDTTETLAAPAGDLTFAFRPVCARERGHEYIVDDLGDDFIIRTNRGAPNYRVVRVPIAESASIDAWQEIVPPSDDVFIEGVLALRDFLVLNVREDGVLHLRVVPWDGRAPFDVPSDDPSSVMYIGANREQDATTLRYVYSALTTPTSDMEIDLETRERRLLKRAFAGDDFDAGKYVSEHLHITAGDGTQIPVSTMRLRETPIDGTAPLLQYAYGAYGLSTDPIFRSSIIPLVNRGFIFAIAHIRGGQECGRRWYDAGRTRNKRNSFTDFIDVTRGLVAAGYSAPDRVFAQGGSAGGLLMGAVANMAPQDYRAIIAQVPFVDVVTTMLDPTIPLTTNEYDEWGNPDDADDYAYMLSYSPYDNVTAQAYPAMLITTGLHDSQVQYWEPMKWVARLRRIGTGDKPILFHTRMDAGHGGASGRYRSFEDIALRHAFILGQLTG